MGKKGKTHVDNVAMLSLCGAILLMGMGQET
jgi:hypothetical protein